MFIVFKLIIMEVIFCVGISGSGKSTWTEQWLQDNPNYIRINRDSLRKALVGSLDGYYQRKDLNELEETVNDLTTSIIHNARIRKYNIIVDNTNLRLKYLNNIRQLSPSNYEIKYKLFDCELPEARKRVMWRDYKDYTVMGAIPDHILQKVDYIGKQFIDYENIKKILLLNPDKLIQ